jgi:nucleotide-binding universal stress UspA family protein
VTAAGRRIAHVAVAYDDSAGARVALAQAVALLKVLPDARLTLIAIDEPEAGAGVVDDRATDDAPAAGTSRPRILTHSRDWIRAANEYAQQHGAQVTAADVRTGHAAGQILIAARAAHADLLVIGHGRHPELHNRVLGSTAEHVVRHAFCSVLVAH